ncbi:kinase-like protein [Myriangium duriaei CBS 260.36]|uniref:Kinase-like protein n=1 Tax=Myriangium duriaei CBS 260.36 TaxID=1168546 RepID=A0A9P4MS01_9PEZI|nr:kinase-like protein [Myriangium duriaei CBS 260.36]
MFSSALKSFSSNITSNYSLSPQPISHCGPWRIFDAKRKNTGKLVSVFVFDKKSLEPQSNGLSARSTASSVKQAQQEVVERLRREASSLARLRHPNVLELAEPVEDTRNGGLMFATEPVSASLASILAELDEQGGSQRSSTGRSSRYQVQDTERAKNSKDFELDELEIQKGLLQIGKGLEFLHESAGLVHANLTPDAIVINSKGDWKITGMAFTGPASDSTKATSSPGIFLSEVLNHDPRLPHAVQLDLDYTSPDFVMDNNLTCAADMFSLGLLIISLYNNPHKSPVECHGGLSAYKRIFASSSTVPSQHNNFLAKGSLPPNLSSDLLPRLITRRPAQRLTAKEFQQAKYFDNILVSTIRFLDSLPGKSAAEKSQFLKGLPRIMTQFPASVLEKKIIPALLEETKDKDLLALILQNVFAIVRTSSTGKRPFMQQVLTKLREVFLAPVAKGATPDQDPAKEAGMMVVLENIQTLADNTDGKEFRDDILPIIGVGLASPTHAVVDAALSTLPSVMPKLDYTTIKNELFPVIAGVFAHTNSLAIKIQGLEAFFTLCGGVADADTGVGDGLDGSITQREESRNNSSAVLDKFTIQEKVVPLMKGIKTKEPAVMMAALKVFKQVGKVADSDYLATEVLPVLWSFALGPLLDLSQFQSFMSLIKSISGHIEREHSRKLQDLSMNNGTSTLGARRNINGAKSKSTLSSNGEEVDFESLVTGRKMSGTPDIINDWNGSAQASQQIPNSFSDGRSSGPTSPLQASSLQQSPQIPGLRPPSNTNRSVTPDQNMSAFASLTPSNAFNQPLQPSHLSRPNMAIRSSSTPFQPSQPQAPQITPSSTIDWSSALQPKTSTPASSAFTKSASFGIAPPPAAPAFQTQPSYGNGLGGFRPPPQSNAGVQNTQSTYKPPQSAQGLDKYESLL